MPHLHIDRLTIVVPDSLVIVNGEAHVVKNLMELLEACSPEYADLHALQFYPNGRCEAEWGHDDDGRRYGNTKLDLADFLPVISAWVEAKNTIDKRRADAELEIMAEAERLNQSQGRQVAKPNFEHVPHTPMAQPEGCDFPKFMGRKEGARARMPEVISEQLRPKTEAALPLPPEVEYRAPARVIMPDNPDETERPQALHTLSEVRAALSRYDDQVRYELALLAHNGNTRAQETFDRHAAAAGKVASELVDEVIRRREAFDEKVMQVHLIYEQAEQRLATASGDEIKAVTDEATRLMQQAIGGLDVDARRSGGAGAPGA